MNDKIKTDLKFVPTKGKNFRSFVFILSFRNFSSGYTLCYVEFAGVLAFDLKIFKVVNLPPPPPPPPLVLNEHYQNYQVGWKYQPRFNKKYMPTLHCIFKF